MPHSSNCGFGRGIFGSNAKRKAHLIPDPVISSLISSIEIPRCRLIKLLTHMNN